MARRSPLLAIHQQGEGLFAPYGPPLGDGSDVQIVEAFDPVEIEYAALRRHVAIFDQPNRATLIVTGADRLEFLNRMITQELKSVAPFSGHRSFWLSRKGRVDADLAVLNLPERVILDCDIHAADRAKTGLSAYIITEDVAIEDATETHHRLGLHGPAASSLLARLSNPVAGATAASIEPDHIGTVRIADAEVIVHRHDTTGEIGLELLVPAARAAAVYEALSTPWSARGCGAATPQTDLARRIGWHALNIARIEAGTPLYYADFGPDSLPHETGVIRDRVSFKKGCYLGQEIVARMESLGHPKQRLCALRIDTPKLANPADRFGQAVTGTRVLDADSPTANTVGAVTSSCTSPMLGSVPVAFAMMKWSHTPPGTQVWLDADGARLPATVRDSLAFWKK